MSPDELTLASVDVELRNFERCYPPRGFHGAGSLCFTSESAMNSPSADPTSTSNAPRESGTVYNFTHLAARSGRLVVGQIEM